MSSSQDVRSYHRAQMSEWEASGPRSVMRTARYERWHPVRALPSEGQTDKLFSPKFCISTAQMAPHERD